MLLSGNLIERLAYRDKLKVVCMLVCFSFLHVVLAEETTEESNLTFTEISSPTVKSLVDYLTTSIPVSQEEVEESSKVVEEMDVFKELTSPEEIFNKFDKDQDERLNFEEFKDLCENLFRNGSEKYKLDNETLNTLFKVFDWNSNGHICKDDFETCYNEWIVKIVNPVSVFVIVDVQNDFITGTLALEKAKEVVDPINKLLESVPFNHVFYSKDWHPENHLSFIENVALRKLHNTSKIHNPEDAKVFDTVIYEGAEGQPIVQALWPAHCVQESWGSQLQEDLVYVKNGRDVYKGTNPEVDSYSAFLDNDKKSMTPLKDYIDEVGAKDVYVCGLAYDICVGSTSVDALDLGFRTILIDDASRGLRLEEIEKMKEKIKGKNGVIAYSNEVKDMVMGVDRKPALGLYLAKDIYARKTNKIL